jgi:ferric enterobactin receptor
MALLLTGDNRNNDYINRAADINPNDIESVSILKGPEAAALYGQDGASGAIIITTKKGTSGAVKIIYDNNFGFQKHYRFPKVQTVYGRGNFGYDDPTTQETQYFGPEVYRWLNDV